MNGSHHRGAEAQRDAELDPVTHRVIGCAIEVHRHLGPGLLESAYETCLAYELRQAGFEVEAQKELPLQYKGITLDCGYRMDLIVDRRLLIELKAVSQLLPIHEAQLLSYMRLSAIPKGLLINFHVPVLKDGIKRMVL